MQLKEHKRRKVTLNIISLIDVVLLLLIFFMLTTRFIEQPGMKLDLPGSQSAEKSAAKELELAIDPNGKMLLNGKAVSLEQLPSRLQELLPEMEDNTLILKADQKVSHGKVVEIMDLARMNGLEKIVIATEVK